MIKLSNQKKNTENTIQVNQEDSRNVLQINKERALHHRNVKIGNDGTNTKGIN